MSAECENCAKTLSRLFVCFLSHTSVDPDLVFVEFFSRMIARCHPICLFRYGRFSKSIRPDEVGPYPLLGLSQLVPARARGPDSQIV